MVLQKGTLDLEGALAEFALNWSGGAMALLSPRALTSLIKKYVCVLIPLKLKELHICLCRLLDKLPPVPVPINCFCLLAPLQLLIQLVLWNNLLLKSRSDVRHISTHTVLEKMPKWSDTPPNFKNRLPNAILEI